MQERQGVRRLVYVLILIGLLPIPAALAQDGDTAAPVSSVIPNDALPVLVSVRSDLELLATSQLGGERPVGWSGSLDVNDPQLALLIRLDLELLLARLLGASTRPDAWFGAVPSTPFAVARDIRHDIELLADLVIAPSVRPPNWSGDRPIMRCDRATQNLVELLQREGRFALAADPSQPDYCRRVTVEVSQFVEINLLSDGSGGSAAAPTGYRANNSQALAFLDRGASRRAGIVPLDVVFTPVARSYAQFSNMALVRGEGFEVFMDYTYTTIPRAVFETLPDVNTANPNPACAADWCG